MESKSVLEMARGAIAERTDYEMAKIIENILDVNTIAAKKRTLTLTLEILPDNARKNLRLTCYARSKLEPTHPVATALYISSSELGKLSVVELTPQVPGQIDFSGAEQAEPYILKIIGG